MEQKWQKRGETCFENIEQNWTKGGPENDQEKSKIEQKSQKRRRNNDHKREQMQM